MPEPQIRKWSDVPEDVPVPKLFRRKLEGEQMLVARIRLEAGCRVELHAHPSEQISVFLSGRARWTIGDQEGIETAGGEVLVIPGGCRHAIEVLEPSEILDVLSPPAPMGVDAQARPAR